MRLQNVPVNRGYTQNDPYNDITKGKFNKAHIYNQGQLLQENPYMKQTMGGGKF